MFLHKLHLFWSIIAWVITIFPVPSFFMAHRPQCILVVSLQTLTIWANAHNEIREYTRKINKRNHVRQPVRRPSLEEWSYQSLTVNLTVLCPTHVKLKSSVNVGFCWDYGRVQARLGQKSQLKRSALSSCSSRLFITDRLAMWSCCQ